MAAMLLYTRPRAAATIPVIHWDDATSEKRAGIAAAIHRACRETGFFYISNHGIAQDLIDAQFEAAHAFFDLPLDVKMSLHMASSPSTAGYEPMGGQRLDSQDPAAPAGPPDLKESFYSVTDLPDDHPWAKRRIRAFGHNQWPRELPGFREQMLKYHEAISQLGRRLLAAIAVSLQLPETWFVPFYEMPTSTLRLIKYPPQPQTAAFNQIGAGAHTDWGGVTLLAQDDVGGLEVRNTEGEWISARPIPGTFVINLGDLTSRWTNGLYKSNKHRVNNNCSGRARYSIPFFFSPNPEAVIEAIPTCVGSSNPRQFATCTAGEHMQEMFDRSYGTIPAGKSA
jgi:isopenicillin N synthase-like dioxygenase